MSNNSLDEQIKSAIEYVEHEFIEITNSTELPINEFIDSTFIPKLKERSPASDKAEGHVRIKGHTFYGKYRDGWSKKTAKFKKTDRVKKKIVYNKNRPELTYMLEYGWERTYTNKTTGGPPRTATVEPQPHIRPTVEELAPVLKEQIIERLKNLGYL